MAALKLSGEIPVSTIWVICYQRTNDIHDVPAEWSTDPSPPKAAPRVSCLEDAVGGHEAHAFLRRRAHQFHHDAQGFHRVLGGGQGESTAGVGVARRIARSPGIDAAHRNVLFFQPHSLLRPKIK
jgi:hypothetical protein